MPSVPCTIIGTITWSEEVKPPQPQPPGIWGGAPLPVPTPPIYLPPQQPPGIWPPAGVVTPPIYYPPEIWPTPPAKPPLGIWGGGNVPMPTPPIYLPPQGGGGGQPPLGIWGGPYFPPGIWGGGNVPMPTPPIYLPPDTIPGLKPEHPVYIPPASPGVPAHPIVLPPPGSGDKPEVLENWQVKTYWSAATGWGVAIVPTESHPGAPTPAQP